jgi:nucleotide-binding universal stress UspA family protein
MTAPDGRVQVVHAWMAPFVDHDLTGHMLQHQRDLAERDVASYAAQVQAMPRPPGVRVSVQLVDGTAVTALDDRSVHADLVVVGSHGIRGLRRLLVGSVAEAVARHAHCSVLVAR